MSEQGMSGQGGGQSAGEGGQGMGDMGQGQQGQGARGQAGMAQGQGQGSVGQGQAGMPYPPQSPPQQGMHYWPGYGYGAPGYGAPQMPGYPPAMGQMHGQGQQHAGQSQGQGQGMAQVMQEIASGGSGLSSLTKLLDFDDKDFWKGALVGAAAVLLLTNENVQRALFRGAVKGRDVVEEGVEKAKDKLHSAKEKGDE